MPKKFYPIAASFIAALAVGFVFGLIGGFDTATAAIAVIAGTLTFVIMHNLSGNRRVANADQATRTRALAFELWPDKTALYLVRTGFVGKAAGMNISLDGKTVAQLKSPRFTRLDIDPGAHTVTASFGGGLAGQTKPVDFQFVSGPSEIVVLKLSMGIGAIKNPVKIERVSADSVRADLAGMQMTAADVTGA